jgi:alanyl-tRNA synthetase
MGDVYPALVENAALIDGIISAEEERFNATLDKGEALLEAELDALDAGVDLPGMVAFTLHDTYGFPIDLTREICEVRGHAIAMEAFDAAMADQRERAHSCPNLGRVVIAENAKRNLAKTAEQAFRLIRACET